MHKMLVRQLFVYNLHSTAVHSRDGIYLHSTAVHSRDGIYYPDVRISSGPGTSGIKGF